MRALRDYVLAPGTEPADTPVRHRGAGATRALRDFMLAPPGPARRVDGAGPQAAEPAALAPEPAALAAPTSVAVLCSAADARALGIATATLLARRHRAACALACVWTTAAESWVERDTAAARAPAGRAARRLAAALSARGLDAVACRRAAAVALPGDPAEAAPAVGRAAAAAGAAPAVLVLGGARGDAFDPVLAACDLILVIAPAGGDDGLAKLAVAGLGPLARRAVACTVTYGPAGRALAAAGLGVPPALRRALSAAPESAR